MSIVVWGVAFVAACALVMLGLHLNRGVVPHGDAGDHGGGGHH